MCIRDSAQYLPHYSASLLVDKILTIGELYDLFIESGGEFESGVNEERWLHFANVAEQKMKKAYHELAFPKKGFSRILIFHNSFSKS